MTPEQQAAYVQSQVVCALAEILGAMSENMQRAACGQSMAYDDAAFSEIPDRYGISHNAVLELFRS